MKRMENSGWKERRLGEVTTKIGSGSTPTGGSNAYKDVGISLIRSQNVLDFSFSKEGLAFIDDEQAYKLRGVIVEENDVLFNITGDSVARVCKVPNKILPARVNQHVAILRADKVSLDHNFLFYQLQSKKEELLILSEIGATRNAITKVMLENLEIALPPLPEQKAIASVLSSLDDKINLLHQQNQTLEALAETLFRQWFIEEAKGDWEEGTISDLVNFNPKRILSRNTVAPFLEMANLSTITYSPSFWYNRAFTSGTKFQNGDTLLARITPCLENGKTAYIDFLEDDQIAWGSTEYIVMHSRGDIHPFFTYVLAKFQEFRDFAQACMSGSSGRQRVDVKNLMSFEFKIPEKSTITKWNKLAKSTVKKTKNNNDQIRTLTSLRDTLLPKLMCGEIRLKV